MSYTPAKTARDRNKHIIRVGDSVRFRGCTGQHVDLPPVKVTAIHKQGANGIILTCEPAPNPAYPHHFGCRASETETCAAKESGPSNADLKREYFQRAGIVL